MNFVEVWTEFLKVLYEDLLVDGEYPKVKPLLAHYTSLPNLENILKNNQLWLSNPLFMNDIEEVRFGVNNGVEIVRSHDALKVALGTDPRREAFYSHFDLVFQEYGADHVLDLYVLCFSVHDPDAKDGKLSMWRGYGNQGKGAAIVLDVGLLPDDLDTPLALGKVHYGTQEERRRKISSKTDEVAVFIAKNNIPDKFLYETAAALFKRVYLAAVFTKHIGFLEEDEWRLVYFKDQDKDVSLGKYFSYFNGPDGMQPKMKLPVNDILEGLGANLTLSGWIHSIIIGPSASSPLVKRSIERMLESIGKEDLKSKVHASGIPFRGG